MKIRKIKLPSDKLSSKALRLECRKLIHNYVLLRDNQRCLRCGATQKLQASHIYPKGKYRKMEFEVDNIKTLCYGCHFHFWHKNPIEAHQWLETVIPKQRLDKLALMANMVDKTPIDFKLLNIWLRQELNKNVHN